MLHICRIPLDSPFRITASNLWTRYFKTILSTLAKAAKDMWSVKKAHRRAEVTGQLIPLPSSNYRKSRHQVDIRLYFKRLKTKTGSFLLSDLSIDHTPMFTLMTELTLQGKRLSRTSLIIRTSAKSPLSITTTTSSALVKTWSIGAVAPAHSHPYPLGQGEELHRVKVVNRVMKYRRSRHNPRCRDLRRRIRGRIIAKWLMDASLN